MSKIRAKMAPASNKRFFIMIAALALLQVASFCFLYASMKQADESIVQMIHEQQVRQLRSEQR